MTDTQCNCNDNSENTTTPLIVSNNPNRYQYRLVSGGGLSSDNTVLVTTNTAGIVSHSHDNGTNDKITSLNRDIEMLKEQSDNLKQEKETLEVISDTFLKTLTQSRQEDNNSNISYTANELSDILARDLARNTIQKTINPRSETGNDIFRHSLHNILETDNNKRRRRDNIEINNDRIPNSYNTSSIDLTSNITVQCLNEGSVYNSITSNGNIYEFNNITYDVNKKIGVCNGNYTITNVDISMPIGFLIRDHNLFLQHLSQDILYFLTLFFQSKNH